MTQNPSSDDLPSPEVIRDPYRFCQTLIEDLRVILFLR